LIYQRAFFLWSFTQKPGALRGSLVQPPFRLGALQGVVRIGKMDGNVLIEEANCRYPPAMSL
jgi:hypothetical protein